MNVEVCVEVEVPVEAEVQVKQTNKSKIKIGSGDARGGVCVNNHDNNHNISHKHNRIAKIIKVTHES